MIKNMDKNIFSIELTHFGSRVYLMKNKGILIDTSSKENQEELIESLEELNTKPSEIKTIILTHNHWDHVGNTEIFKNAKIYGNKKDFEDDNIQDIKKLQGDTFEIIEAPGHTPGSTCILLKENKILFSGDVLFHNGIGRTDFKESSPKDMGKSLEKLDKVEYNLLCPGH